MSDSVLLQVRFHNTVPIFTLPFNSPEPARAYGATLARHWGEWVFPAFHPFGQRVVEDLKLLFKERLVLSQDAKKCLAYLERVPKLVEEQHIPNDYKFRTEPMDHQREALCHALYSPRFGIFAEVGLGKTKIMIDLMQILDMDAPSFRWIVLVSKAGLHVWRPELEKHGNGKYGCVVIEGGPKKKEALIQEAIDKRDDWLFLVSTYESAKNLSLHLPRLRARGIICDESHKIRRTQSGNHKSAFMLSATTGRRVLLTGTPALGDPLHIWAQMQVMAPFLLTRNRRKFINSHIVHAVSNPHIVTGYKNLEALNRSIRPVTRKYRQEECLDLPERTFIDRNVVAERSIRKHYNQLIDDAMTVIAGKEVVPGNAAIIIWKLQQLLSGFIIIPLKEDICNGCAHLDYCVKEDIPIRPYTKRCKINRGPPPTEIARTRGASGKIEALTADLEEILTNPTSKVIIWAAFTEELNLLEEMIKEMIKIVHPGVDYVRVEGSMTAKKAKACEDRFQEDPECRVYLAQIATGESITLTAADYMMYFSQTYRLDHYIQSLGRNYRIGQERKAFVFRYLTKGSVEEIIVANLDRKIDISESMTAKVNCVLCEQNFMCLVDGIEPFTPKCKFMDAAGKVRARPRFLPHLG